jgi:hypothetical protein
MARHAADILQLVGLLLLVAAAWTVSTGLGLVASGAMVLTVGVAVDPRIGRR